MNTYRLFIALIRSLKQHKYFQKHRWIIRLVIVVFALYCLSWIYPDEGFYSPKDRKVNSLDYKYAILPRHVCSRDSSPSLLVLVLSTLEGIAQRKAIRETWGSIARNSTWPSRHISVSVKFVYLFGLSEDPNLNKRLEDEANMFGDVLQIGLVDTYGLNVTKKLLMGMKWARQHCGQTRHLMKVDDDVFVDVPHVINHLKYSDLETYIAGHVVLFPIVRRFGKYFLSFKEYPYFILPSYILGYFYVMPMKVVSRFVVASQYVPYLRMEDVYITAILSRVTKTPIKAFRTFFTQRNFGINTCDFVSGERDASVDISPETMYTVWRTYQNKSICSSASHS